MATNLTAWLFLLFMKGCFANNVTFNETSSLSLTTLVRQSSLAVLNSANMSTVSPTATILLSTSHAERNITSTSVVQRPSSKTIFTENNGTPGNKPGTIQHTGTKISSTTSTLLPRLSSHISSLLKADQTKPINGSHSTVNSSLTYISTRRVSTQQNLTTYLSSTVVHTGGSNKTTESSTTRETLLPGQLAGVALILFILVVLLLIICLGNFADEPVINERELFTEEVSMENLGKDKDNQGQQEDEEWKFDPLFAWSPRKSFDSKL